MVFAGEGENYQLELKPSPVLLRGAENEILVALISSLSVGLGALITGLLNVMVQKNANKITIKSKSGSQFEVPVNFDIDKVKELVEELKRLDEDVNVVVD